MLSLFFKNLLKLHLYQYRITTKYINNIDEKKYAKEETSIKKQINRCERFPKCESQSVSENSERINVVVVSRKIMYI